MNRLRIILLLCCCWLDYTTAFAQQRLPSTNTFWQWSPPRPYHDAAVCVRAGRSAGSGSILTASNDPRRKFALTNHHVISSDRGIHSQVIVQTKSGLKIQGKVTHYSSADNGYDLALIDLGTSHANLVSVQICTADPPLGTVLEMAGFGGPNYGRFRSFFAKRIEPELGAMAIDAPTISGDSGSGILWGGCLVGVNFGGPNAQRLAVSRSSGSIPLVYPASSHASQPTLARLLSEWMRDLGCVPTFANPGSYGPGVPSDDQFYPPQDGGSNMPISYQCPPYRRPPPQPIYQPPSQPIQPKECIPITFDYAKVADALLKNSEFISLISSQRGPAGANGPAGPPGPPGQVDLTIVQGMIQKAIAESGVSNVPNIDLDLLASIIANKHADLLRGPKGDKGDKGDTGIAGQVPPTPTDADSRILYFTSQGCKECITATEKIEALKAKGAPITIITLSEKDAATNGVPMIFVPKTNRKVIGLANVLSYLTLVTW